MSNVNGFDTKLVSYLLVPFRGRWVGNLYFLVTERPGFGVVADVMRGDRSVELLCVGVIFPEFCVSSCVISVVVGNWVDIAEDLLL